LNALEHTPILTNAVPSDAFDADAVLRPPKNHSKHKY
jgi:hypothetical protein